MPAIPRFLWHLFGKNGLNKALTLANTIVSLIPPPPPTPADCRCRKRRRRRRCIRCSGLDPMSFLLRPDDPSDYRSLLTRCFVVVNSGAPDLPEFEPYSNWSQPQIVAHTIEKMKHDSEVPNVIFRSYFKYSQSSPILELLTSSAWCTLLTRVGETVMVYLLMHTSIFLPQPEGIYLQVAGAPVNGRDDFWEHTSMSKHGHPSARSRKRTRQFSLQGSTKRSRVGHQGSTKRNRVGLQGSTKRNRVGLQGSTKHSRVDLQGSTKRSRVGLQGSTKRSRVGLQGINSTTHLPTVSTHEESGRHQTDLYASSKWNCRKVPHDWCMQFLTSQGVDEQAQIDRKSIFFYLSHPSYVFPTKHMLFSYALDPLLRDIFGLSAVNVCDHSTPCSNNGHFCPFGSTCLYHALTKMIKNLKRRTKRCQHKILLNRHCPIPDPTCIFKESKSGASSSDTKHHKSSHAIDPMHDAIKSYSSKSQVVSFIWAVCRSIIPPALLGTTFNWRILRRNISKFIQLRRFENFYFKQCMHKLDVSGFWDFHELKYWTEQAVVMLGGSSESKDIIYNIKQKLVEKWILWLFSSVVVPLVKTHFYVTESQHGRHNVYYYRKSVWENLIDKAFTRLKAQNCCQLYTEKILGFSSLRFLPKENEMRVLSSFKAASKVPKSIRYVLSVKTKLHDMHDILKSLKSKHPEKLGSSVFDYNDVYKQLRTFVQGLRSGLANMPDVFIVSCDVSKAFDSINHDKLLTVMKEFILEGERLNQSTQDIRTKNCQSVQKSTGLTRCASSAFHNNSSHGIIVDNNREFKMTKKGMLVTLETHVKQNIFCFDGQFYLKGVGISQGSILSCLLCSLYYGHLETNVIYPFLENAYEDEMTSFRTYMLLRFMDDFLFISTSKKQASRFFSRMREGFSDYNCYMNEGKFSLNFDVGLPSNKLYVCKDGTSFLRWSGLFINCHTLEVQVDYTRYLKNHLMSTLTVSWGDKQDYRTTRMILNFLQPKCRPIFFDSNINSAATVRHMCKLIKRMKSVPLGPNLLPDVQLEDDEVEWLGLKAYLKVLAKKQSRHEELLSLLRLNLSTHKITGSLSSALTYAIDDSHSSVMWEIKY